MIFELKRKKKKKPNILVLFKFGRTEETGLVVIIVFPLEVIPYSLGKLKLQLQVTNILNLLKLKNITKQDSILNMLLRAQDVTF